MRLSFLLCALCLSLLVGAAGCGGDDVTSSQTQNSGAAERSATTAESGGETEREAGASGGDEADPSGGDEADPSGGDEADPSGGDEADPDTPPDSVDSKIFIGEYEGEGPFAAISGQPGNKKPRFTPSGQPAPKKVVTRDLEVGSGPAAERGDEVSVYFAGAISETGKVELYGWPPSAPSTFELGAGLYGRDWEKTIEGMKAGGIRQVILPSSEFARGRPVDYVIVLTDLQPKSD